MWYGESKVEALTDQPDIHIGVSRTHLAEEEHWLLKFVFWLPHVPHSLCTLPLYKTINSTKQMFL